MLQNNFWTNYKHDKHQNIFIFLHLQQQNNSKQKTVSNKNTLRLIDLCVVNKINMAIYNKTNLNNSHIFSMFKIVSEF